MTPIYSDAWAWASWIVIGLVSGCLAGCFLPGRRIVVMDILIALVGAVAGGLGSALALKEHTPQSFAIAALVALLVCGAMLWIYNCLLIYIDGKKR